MDQKTINELCFLSADKHFVIFGGMKIVVSKFVEKLNCFFIKSEHMIVCHDLEDVELLKNWLKEIMGDENAD